MGEKIIDDLVLQCLVVCSAFIQVHTTPCSWSGAEFPTAAPPMVSDLDSSSDVNGDLRTIASGNVGFTWDVKAAPMLIPIEPGVPSEDASIGAPGRSAGHLPVCSHTLRCMGNGAWLYMSAPGYVLPYGYVPGYPLLYGYAPGSMGNDALVYMCTPGY